MGWPDGRKSALLQPPQTSSSHARTTIFCVVLLTVCPRRSLVNFLGWSTFTSKLVKFSKISERLLRSQRQLTWSLKTATMNLRIVKTLLCPLWSRSEPSQSLQTHPRHGSAVCQLPPLNLAPLGLLLRFLRVLRQARCTQPPDPDHISVLITFCCYLCAPSSLIH
ncbi:hypothetical protein OJAV_G00235420 [Oryzias javanicus]|uniref:Uncharacterized protein n=1 Tax=Oryzias javanicus TaxID=123683 RepID=A0A437BYH2_ORYJA|nr:hypothetical protein OJAV_G00235420 [Oryzias javanicus]